MNAGFYIPGIVVLLASAGLSTIEDDFLVRMRTVSALHARGEYEGAEKLLLSILHDTESLQPAGERRAVVLNNLGSVYHKMDRFRDAEYYYRRAVEIEDQVWGAAEDRQLAPS